MRWSKDEVRQMRGKVKRLGDLLDDAVCENSEIISKEDWTVFQLHTD